MNTGDTLADKSVEVEITSYTQDPKTMQMGIITGIKPSGTKEPGKVLMEMVAGDTTGHTPLADKAGLKETPVVISSETLNEEFGCDEATFAVSVEPKYADIVVGAKRSSENHQSLREMSTEDIKTMLAALGAVACAAMLATSELLANDERSPEELRNGVTVNISPKKIKEVLTFAYSKVTVE